jgi:hypothetical protein
VEINHCPEEKNQWNNLFLYLKRPGSDFLNLVTGATWKRRR